jgi:hypothetical protein
MKQLRHERYIPSAKPMSLPELKINAVVWLQRFRA